MQIRLFQSSDATQVANIIQRNLREVNTQDYVPEELQKYIDYFTPEQVENNAQIRTVFVAVEDTEVLGTAGYVKSNNPEMEGAFLLTVFILPDVHGQGIGKMLVQTIEEDTRKNGFQTMYVPSGRTAIGFYQKLGYEFVESTPKEDAEGNTLMYKKF